VKNFNRDAASRAVSIPAQDYLPGDNDRDATGDRLPPSAEDRNAKDRGRQDAVGAISENNPPRALSTQVEGSTDGEAPRVSVPTFHLTHLAASGVGRKSFSHGRLRAVVVEKVTRRLLAPSERPGFPARGSAPDGGEKFQNTLSEPAVKNASPGGATAAAPNAPTSGDTEPASGRAGSETTRRASSIPLPIDSRRLLTESALAARLSLSPATLRNWRVKGLGPPFVQLSRRAVRYRAEDVDQWIATRECRSTSDGGGENG